MADEGLRYEVRGDGILFHLRAGVTALVAYRTTVRHRVELWRNEILLAPDVGDLSTASFRRRLAKAAVETFGELPHIEEDLGRLAAVLERSLEFEDGDEANGKTMNDLLRGLSGLNVTQALVRLGSEAELFHDPEGESYATIEVDGHRETWSMRSRGFRNWIRYRYHTVQKEKGEESPDAPRASVLNDALAQLEAKSQFDGPEHFVHVRVAEHDGAYYLDLADEEWRAVEITPEGWRVIHDPPVKFVRAKGMRPLPVPTRGGDVNRLRALVNLKDDDHDGWRLLLAWLIQALRPRGPYPVLILQGEQGSAKSTVERLVRALVDPSTVPLRAQPRNEHDLYIDATNAWILAFDNISSLPPWLSDALCRMSTGGGFGTRTLYENREQELFDATRPVILNGISDPATRPDLLDRAIILLLPPIPEKKRVSESELWGDLERERPAILGGLLDAMSGAMRELPGTKLDSLPRMADFALWATAAEGSFGWEPGAFLRTYRGSLDEAHDVALETDPVAAAVLALMQDRADWTGTAAELWKALGDLVDEEVRRSKGWPGAPHTLTTRMRRLAPVLRQKGLEYVEESRKGPKGTKPKRLLWTPTRERQERQRGDAASQRGEIGADTPTHTDARSEGADARTDASAPEDPLRKRHASEGNNLDSDAPDALSQEHSRKKGGHKLTVAEAQEEIDRSGSGAYKQAELWKAGEITTENAAEWITKAILRRRGMETGDWHRHESAVRAALNHLSGSGSGELEPA